MYNYTANSTSSKLSHISSSRCCPLPTIPGNPKDSPSGQKSPQKTSNHKMFDHTPKSQPVIPFSSLSFASNSSKPSTSTSNNIHFSSSRTNSSVSTPSNSSSHTSTCSTPIPQNSLSSASSTQSKLTHNPPSQKPLEFSATKVANHHLKNNKIPPTHTSPKISQASSLAVVPASVHSRVVIAAKPAQVPSRKPCMQHHSTFLPNTISKPPLTTPTSSIQTQKSSVVPTISTSKKWVLPPRPKPGRKPCANNHGQNTTCKKGSKRYKSKKSNSQTYPTAEGLIPVVDSPVKQSSVTSTPQYPKKHDKCKRKNGFQKHEKLKQDLDHRVAKQPVSIKSKISKTKTGSLTEDLPLDNNTLVPTSIFIKSPDLPLSGIEFESLELTLDLYGVSSYLDPLNIDESPNIDLNHSIDEIQTLELTQSIIDNQALELAQSINENVGIRNSTIDLDPLNSKFSQTTLHSDSDFSSADPLSVGIACDIGTSSVTDHLVDHDDLNPIALLSTGFQTLDALDPLAMDVDPSIPIIDKPTVQKLEEEVDMEYPKADLDSNKTYPLHDYDAAIFLNFHCISNKKEIFENELKPESISIDDTLVFKGCVNSVNTNTDLDDAENTSQSCMVSPLIMLFDNLPLNDELNSISSQPLDTFDHDKSTFDSSKLETLGSPKDFCSIEVSNIDSLSKPNTEPCKVAQFDTILSNDQVPDVPLDLVFVDLNPDDKTTLQEQTQFSVDSSSEFLFSPTSTNTLSLYSDPSPGPATGSDLGSSIASPPASISSFAKCDCFSPNGTGDQVQAQVKQLQKDLFETNSKNKLLQTVVDKLKKELDGIKNFPKKIEGC